MNVLFVYSYHDIQSSSKPLKLRTQTQFGISYISALLKKNGHNTRLIVLSKKLGRKNRNRIDKCVEAFSPQLICFTAVFSEYEFITGIAKYVRGRYSTIFLLILKCCSKMRLIAGDPCENRLSRYHAASRALRN